MKAWEQGYLVCYIYKPPSVAGTERTTADQTSHKLAHVWTYIGILQDITLEEDHSLYVEVTNSNQIHSQDLITSSHAVPGPVLVVALPAAAG